MKHLLLESMDDEWAASFVDPTASVFARKSLTLRELSLFLITKGTSDVVETPVVTNISGLVRLEGAFIPRPDDEEPIVAEVMCVSHTSDSFVVDHI